MPTGHGLLRRLCLLLSCALLLCAAGPSKTHWVVAWTASAHGPYPVGNATAQPDLRFAFPTPAQGASDQTFRLIVRPDIWGQTARLRLSNAFGAQAVTFNDVFAGLQVSGAELLPGSNHAVTFGGRHDVTVPPGGSAFSDPVRLAFVHDPADPWLDGRKLAVSFHVAGDTGPMTWHAKALTTSYVSAPGSGSRGAETGEASFPYSTTSWYFLDAVDMQAAPATHAVVAFGDSITDGTDSTLNGDDRWPDVFARRMHAAFGNRFSVVNTGIGGNMVIGPADYAQHPFSGGPAALQRLDRDVISLPGVSAVIWLEGINDFGNAGAGADAVEAGVRQGVQRLREALPGVRIIMATLTSSLHSTNGQYGSPEVEAKRQAFNRFVRETGTLFDGVADFDAVTQDRVTGELKPDYQPNSTTGGPGDRLHPNRAGYAAMARAIDLKLVAGEK
jgi:lysophospholipase L1-like esterase